MKSSAEKKTQDVSNGYYIWLLKIEPETKRARLRKPTAFQRQKLIESLVINSHNCGWKGQEMSKLRLEARASAK